jgi:uncharacterized membrane protein YhaH (DUF805 family)
MQRLAARAVFISPRQGFWELSFQPLIKYADFKGRASRTEYWGFILITFLIGVGFAIIGVLTQASWLSDIVSLALLIPSIAVGVRRMHDTDRSGWWYLMPIVNLVFLCFDSQREENRFGMSSKPN